MSRAWEEVKEETLTDRLFPTEEAFPDQIMLMRYRSQLAVGLSLLLVLASFVVDVFDPPNNAGVVWTVRAGLLVVLATLFMFTRSSLASLPKLYTMTYVNYFALASSFALVIGIGRQAVLFTAFHVIAVGILLRPLSGTQATFALGIVTLGALSVSLGIVEAEGWREFIPAFIILLGTELIVLMVSDMNFKLQVAEGEARERMEEAMRKMNFLSSFDHLTRVMNRRNFEDALENALLEARSNAQGLAYLEIDLDYFKDINDTYGHQAGDAVLRAASERIASCLRTGDLVGRMGGDEFAAAVKGATTDVAERVAGRILEKFKETPVRTSWGDIPISCTVGIGCYPGKGPATTSALMAAADESLYEAKEAGRGRVGRAVIVSLAQHAPRAEQIVPGVGLPSLEISAAPGDLGRELETLAPGGGQGFAGEALPPEVPSGAQVGASSEEAPVATPTPSRHLDREEPESSEEPPVEAPVPPPPHLRGQSR